MVGTGVASCTLEIGLSPRISLKYGCTPEDHGIIQDFSQTGEVKRRWILGVVPDADMDSRKSIIGTALQCATDSSK